jgi:hypothetical protein
MAFPNDALVWNEPYKYILSIEQQAHAIFHIGMQFYPFVCQALHRNNPKFHTMKSNIGFLMRTAMEKPVLYIYIHMTLRYRSISSTKA